jgi:isocitrate dehydrogenase (NAD+)
MFEAVHGSAPDIAGQGVANPTALLLAACLMLDHLDDADTAQRIRAAVDRVIQEGKVRTVDMGGDAGTTAYTHALVDALE